MSENKNVNVGCSTPYFFFAVLVAMVGYQIHHSIFWAIMDFVFWPFAVVKWLVLHQVNKTIIEQTFSFFLQ